MQAAKDVKFRCSSLGLIVPKALLTHFRKGGKAGTFPITKTMETEIEKLFFNDVFDFRKTFTNKFVQKGNILEAQSIMDLIKHLKLPLATKNCKRHRNAWIQGEMDLDFSNIGFQIDMKNVYYPEGLDTFEKDVDHIYEVQQHGYNWLLKITIAFVVKILKNPPESILIKEAYSLMKQAGIHEMTAEFEAEVRDLMDFEGKQPIENRINIYSIKTEQYHIDAMKEGVRLARQHWQILQAKWAVKNTSEIKIINDLKKKALAK